MTATWPGGPLTPRQRDVDWLLDELVDNVVGATGLVLLSADGLLIGSSRGVSTDDGDRLSAVASGFQSLAQGAGRQFGGGTARQTIVELDTAFLVITAAGRGACLALLATVKVDLGEVAYALNLLVKRVGAVLGAEPRAEAQAGHGGR